MLKRKSANTRGNTKVQQFLFINFRSTQTKIKYTHATY